MGARIRHLLSWSLGLLGLAAVIWYFQLSTFAADLARVGAGGALAWLLLTILARLLLVEITIQPLGRLGYVLARSDAFWIGWVRTFANQVLPLAGLAVFAREIRRKTEIPWPALVSLSTPMVLFAASAVSLLGLAAVATNADTLGPSTLPMLAAFALLSSASIFAASHAAWLLEKIPAARSLFAQESAAAFRQVSGDAALVTRVIAFHCAAILLRGTRIWLLFLAVGVDLSAPGALLLAVIAESVALFQLTPGGLGLREGAIVGGAALIGIDPATGAVVALIDRLFMIAVTTFLAIPGYWLIRR